MTHSLVLDLEKMVRTERKITDQIIKTLIQIEEQKIHLDMGYSSIFAFLVQHLGYSESAAQRRNTAMKLFKKVPEISEKLQDGSLNLTQVSELERVTRLEPKFKIQSVIAKIENKNTRQTQHIIAKEFNLPAIQHEKTRTQKDESVYMQITLTKDQFELFKQASDLLSHIKPGATHAEVITLLAQKFVKQKLGKEADFKKTCESRQISKANASPETAAPAAALKLQKPDAEFSVGTSATAITKLKPKSIRKPISIKSRRILLKKAQHQCEFISSTGQRCQAHTLLEVDHIHPVRQGGQNNLQNLRIYCRAHNQARG